MQLMEPAAAAHHSFILVGLCEMPYLNLAKMSRRYRAAGLSELLLHCHAGRKQQSPGLASAGLKSLNADVIWFAIGAGSEENQQ